VQFPQRRNEGAIINCKLLTEFLGKFILPLLRQPGRGDHQHPARHAPQFELLIDQGGFDGLAQAHLISDERARAGPVEDEIHRQDLMRQGRDAKVGNSNNALLREQRLQLVYCQSRQKYRCRQRGERS